MRRSTYKETTGAHASRFFTESARRMVAAGVSATLVFSLAACGATNATTETTDAKSATSEEATNSETVTTTTTSTDSDIYEVAKAFTIDTADLFSARDTDASYDADSATKITLADSGVTLKGTGATVEGSNVTITDEGTYVVEGTISDGRIVVDAADDAKVQIVLSGASITSSGPSAFYVRNADKVFLTLEGDKNAVSATGADAEEDEHNLDGAIFASVDLTINGEGSLTVKSERGAGIVAKDELTLSGPTLTVDGATHAVQAKDSLAVDEGTYTFTAATKDAIHVEHDTNGTKGFMYVSGGTFNLTAADDGIHASNDILIDGGTFKIAAKDDGIHSEYDLVVNDGTIDVTESGEGIEGATFTQNGGAITAKASDDGVNATGYPTAEKDARSAEFTGLRVRAMADGQVIVRIWTTSWSASSARSKDGRLKMMPLQMVAKPRLLRERRMPMVARTRASLPWDPRASLARCPRARWIPCAVMAVWEDALVVRWKTVRWESLPSHPTVTLARVVPDRWEMPVSNNSLRMVPVMSQG